MSSPTFGGFSVLLCMDPGAEWNQTLESLADEVKRRLIVVLKSHNFFYLVNQATLQPFHIHTVTLNDIRDGLRGGRSDCGGPPEYYVCEGNCSIRDPPPPQQEAAEGPPL